MELQEELAAEFKDIRFRIGRSSKGKEKRKFQKGDWATFLAYVDARDVMQRLDDIVGLGNWSDEYEDIGGMLVCRLTVNSVTKCDTGSESNVEKEKGHFSDAFKRAAVKFGIGRHLYNMKSPFLRFDDGHFDTYGNITDKGIAMVMGEPAIQQAAKEEIKQGIIERDEKRKAAEEFVDEFKGMLDDCRTAAEALTLLNEDKKASALEQRHFDLYDELSKYAGDIGE